MRRNKGLCHATTGINFENMLVREASYKGFILYDLICMKYPEQVNLQRHKVDGWLPKAGSGGGMEWGVTANWYRVSFMDSKMFQNQTILMVVQPMKIVKTIWILHFKWEFYGM